MVKLRIKEAREAKGFNQAELAAAIGMQPGSLGRYENNYIERVSLTTLENIARVLGVSVADLLDEKETA